MLLIFATLRTLLETVAGLIGLVLRVGVLAFFAAIALRLLGLVQPELLPGFWLVVTAGVFVLLPAGVSMGKRDVYREERDKTIKAAEERYKGRV
jgi:hypothetical protein